VRGGGSSCISNPPLPLKVTRRVWYLLRCSVKRRNITENQWLIWGLGGDVRLELRAVADGDEADAQVQQRAVHARAVA